jgi:hypothetical protein
VLEDLTGRELGRGRHAAQLEGPAPRQHAQRDAHGQPKGFVTRARGCQLPHHEPPLPSPGSSLSRGTAIGSSVEEGARRATSRSANARSGSRVTRPCSGARAAHRRSAGSSAASAQRSHSKASLPAARQAAIGAAQAGRRSRPTSSRCAGPSSAHTSMGTRPRARASRQSSMRALATRTEASGASSPTSARTCARSIGPASSSTCCAASRPGAAFNASASSSKARRWPRKRAPNQLPASSSDSSRQVRSASAPCPSVVRSSVASRSSTSSPLRQLRRS